MLLHREILKAPKGASCDHINRDGLDNRKVNLRLCNHSQNALHMKRSVRKQHTQYRGVYFHKEQNHYDARMKFKGKDVWIGAYPTALQAADAYDETAKRIAGEFAVLNFPPSDLKEVLK